MDLDFVSQDVKDACIKIRKFEEAAKKSRCSSALTLERMKLRRASTSKEKSRQIIARESPYSIKT